FVSQASSGTLFTTGIYNEDGILLFSDTGAAQIMPNEPLQQYPIYNTTSNGTIMILSYRNWQAKVFSLAGTLTTAIDRANAQLVSNGASVANPRPNPTNNTTTIEYTLPQGTNQAELVFYSIQGIEVKRFKVDNTFSSLLISTADIAAGTYYYNLQVGGNASGSKKMVVVK
ncbi:MAG TPA: T9SS type A sorting domain-containing protein, partial [Bacteroidia bacterium]